MATEAQLNEAKAAYHKLLTGTGVASIQKDGRKVEFTPANKHELKAYVDELTVALGTVSRRRGPARVY